MSKDNLRLHSRMEKMHLSEERRLNRRLSLLWDWLWQANILIINYLTEREREREEKKFYANSHTNRE